MKRKEETRVTGHQSDRQSLSGPTCPKFFNLPFNSMKANPEELKGN